MASCRPVRRSKSFRSSPKSARGAGPDRRRRRGREYARAFAPLIRPDEEDLFVGLDLFEASSQLGPFDAVLAATALRREWALASADRSFGQVVGLVYLDPSSATFVDDMLDTADDGERPPPAR